MSGVDCTLSLVTPHSYADRDYKIKDERVLPKTIRERGAMFFRVSELKKHFDNMQQQTASSSASAVPDASPTTLATHMDTAGGSALPSLYLSDGMDMVQRFVRDDNSDIARRLVKIPHGGGKFVLLEEVRHYGR